VLRLQVGASKAEIKQSFYARAKEVHPNHGGSEESFVELLNAFEELMAEASHGSKSNRSARTSAAPRQRRSSGGATKQKRDYTLGEVLCERLRDDEVTAATLESVYAEVKQLFDSGERMTELIIDALIGAGMRTGGLDDARALLHDGKANGLFAGPTLVTALAALIKWGSTDKRLTFGAILEELPPHEQTPEALEALQNSFLLHFRYDPLTRWL